MTDDKLRRFLDEEAPTLPSETVKDRLLRGLSMAARQIDALSADVERMDMQSEATRLVVRRKIGEIVGLLWGIGQPGLK